MAVVPSAHPNSATRTPPGARASELSNHDVEQFCLQPEELSEAWLFKFEELPSSMLARFALRVAEAAWSQSARYVERGKPVQANPSQPKTTRPADATNPEMWGGERTRLGTLIVLH